MFIQRLREKEEGFTLIELLIVVAIIAILAAIAIPQFSAYRQRGVRGSMISDARNTATQLEAIFSDEQTYVIPLIAGPFVGPSQTIVGPGPLRQQTYTISASAGNTTAIVAGALVWNLTVTNLAAGTGAGGVSMSPLTMTSAGSCLYGDGTAC